MYLVAARMLLTLMAPHRPLSVVTRIITARLPSRLTRNGCLYSVARSLTVWSTSIILSAYGRVACTAACARRSRVAATTCIALVIFCVFLIESIRRTMSLYAGNYYFSLGFRCDLGFSSSAERIWSSCDGRGAPSSSSAAFCGAAGLGAGLGAVFASAFGWGFGAALGSGLASALGAALLGPGSGMSL